MCFGIGYIYLIWQELYYGHSTLYMSYPLPVNDRQVRIIFHGELRMKGFKIKQSGLVRTGDMLRFCIFDRRMAAK